jgi:hypothetical protein
MVQAHPIQRNQSSVATENPLFTIRSAGQMQSLRVLSRQQFKYGAKLGPLSEFEKIFQKYQVFSVNVRSFSPLIALAV